MAIKRPFKSGSFVGTALKTTFGVKQKLKL